MGLRRDCEFGVLRLSPLAFESGDYRAFLSQWYDSLLVDGRWRVLGAPAAHFQGYCYPAAYLYLVSLSTLLPLPKLYAIKLLSVAADYIGAWYAWMLARRAGLSRRRAWTVPTVILFLPTVVMNSALWGQCDMMYTCALLASLFCVAQHRSVAALVAFGFACSLKPQAIFWCPFVLGLLVSGRLAWRQIWIPAAVYVGCAIPAILAGRPVLDALLGWGGAAVNPRKLALGAPNWYEWTSWEVTGDLYRAGSGPYAGGHSGPGMVDAARAVAGRA